MAIAMLCRTARVYNRVACRPLQCQRQPYFLRSNSTSPSHNNKVNTLAHDTAKETEKKRGDYPSTRTAHIRLWEPVHNMADVWSIKRAMEKKYGAILETHFLKVRLTLFVFVFPKCTYPPKGFRSARQVSNDGFHYIP